ncbi:MAG: glycosyltransferase family 4 protein [Bacteroidota bacterium]
MKIVHIVPGFGGTFYCGNCLRDSGVVASLKKAGHDAVTLPMYLPLTLNGQPSDNEIPVFYGAVNIYLKQFPVFRHMPKWFEKLMDSPALLKYAAKKSGSTRASGLEDLTESMLLGSEGHQSEELQQLTDFLKFHEKPDIIHFSNVLLLGMAKQIRDEVKVPVVYSLQDEDVWIDAMHQDRREKMWQLLAEKAKDVDAFIAVSRFFADVMQSRMSIPDSKLHVLHVGVDPEAYNYSRPAKTPQVIGFVSRICEENGFEILVDAFIRLRENPAFSTLKLKATGGMTGDDTRFINKQINKLKQRNIDGDFEIQADFTLNGLRGFFKSVTVLSVPVLKGEAFGLYQLEALASGVPLVQPELGAFPEIISASGGGVTYKPNTASALAEKLAEVLSDPTKLESMSLAGRKAVEEHFDCRKLSVQMVEVYKTLIDGQFKF